MAVRGQRHCPYIRQYVVLARSLGRIHPTRLACVLPGNIIALASNDCREGPALYHNCEPQSINNIDEIPFPNLVSYVRGSFFCRLQQNIAPSRPNPPPVNILNTHTKSSIFPLNMVTFLTHTVWFKSHGHAYG